MTFDAYQFKNVIGTNNVELISIFSNFVWFLHTFSEWVFECGYIFYRLLMLFVRQTIPLCLTLQMYWSRIQMSSTLQFVSSKWQLNYLNKKKSFVTVQSLSNIKFISSYNFRSRCCLDIQRKKYRKYSARFWTSRVLINSQSILLLT